MARRKNPAPIITQEAILAMAGQHIQSEIIKLRREGDDLAAKVEAVGRVNEVEHIRQATENQVAYHMERLKAVETMYQIQTGTELGMIAELE